jgi:hypothetical protein
MKYTCTELDQYGKYILFKNWDDKYTRNKIYDARTQCSKLAVKLAGHTGLATFKIC